jgi:hypothetical protein
VRVGALKGDTDAVKLLSARCGSEANAAHELIVGDHGRGTWRSAKSAEAGKD